jgi:hypothetical protein
MRRIRFMPNLDALFGGTIDERLAEAVRELRKDPSTTIQWQAKTDDETREVGDWFRLLGYRTKVSTDGETCAEMMRDVLGAMLDRRPYQVTVWTDGTGAAA